jgi:hypothetical protein
VKTHNTRGHKLPRLGFRQEQALERLRAHGWWDRERVPWRVDSKATTRRRLDALVLRGYVTVDEQGVYRPV